MSTELKGFEGRVDAETSTKVSMTRFFGGKKDGVCVQLTDQRCQHLQFTKEQALVAAEALLQFVNGTREEFWEE